MKTITPKQFAFFHVAFYNDEHNINMRIGQVFCNRFMITDYEIFYETDYIKATEMIYSRYIREECGFCGAKNFKEYEGTCTGECNK